MSRQVEWAKRALKELRRLDKTTQSRIASAVDELATKSRGDVRRLEGAGADVYRLRIGGWRVIFTLQPDGALLVLRVRPRGDAYKS